MMKITYKLKADSINYAKIVFRDNDPKELFIAINEFAWNISKKKGEEIVKREIKAILNEKKNN